MSVGQFALEMPEEYSVQALVDTGLKVSWGRACASLPAVFPVKCISLSRVNGIGLLFF